MTGPRNPYPVYKPSGVEWLGEVPAHWGLHPGRACYKYKQTLNRGWREKTVLSLSFGSIVIRPESKLRGLVPISFETYQIVEPGDIICRSTDLQNDWNSLRFGLSRYLGIITSAYLCLNTLASLSSRYGYLLLHTYDLTKVFYGLGSGLRQNLGWTDFKQLPCLIPPLPEQAAIANFLDHADGRIRRYIRAGKKLVALLKEQKQAIIHSAVTGQIDVRTGEPYSAYKPSGVEWIGDVPEHWEVRRLGQIGTFSKGKGGSKEDERESGLPCIRYGDLYTVHETFIRHSRSFVSWERARDYASIYFGDVLFAASGETTDDIGKSAVNLMRTEACCGGDVILFRSRRKSDARYLGYATSCRPANTQKAMMGRGFTIIHIYSAQLKRLGVVLPPLPEQNTIVRFLDEATANIDRSIVRVRRQIDLLREFRTRLIADVVTGKLDVRHLACESGSVPQPENSGEYPADELDNESNPMTANT